MRQIFGQGKPIYFDFSIEKYRGYTRLKSVIDFLVERGFIKWDEQYEEGHAPDPKVPRFGNYSKLGEEPRMIKDVDGKEATLDRPSTEKSRKWLAQLTPDGHAYFEQRIRLIQQHESIISTNTSTRKTNWFIGGTFGAVLASIIFSYHALNVTVKENQKFRDQLEQFHKEDSIKSLKEMQSIPVGVSQKPTLKK